MAVVRKWDGVGVTDGTLGSKVGSGDDAFDASNADPSVGAETISKAGGTQHRWSWTGLNLGAVAIRFYFVQRSAPSGTSVLMEARDGSNRIFGVSINTSNQLALRNAANSAVSTSGAITIGRLYRVDLWKASGNTTIQFRVHDVMAGTDLHSGSGSPGSSSNVTVVEFGQNSGTNAGGYRYSHMRVDDTDARIGAYEAIANDFDVATTRYGSSTAGTSHTVPLPSTEYDDLLVMFARGASGASPSVPGGWSALTSASSDESRVFTRQATGSEGATVSVSLSTSEHLAAVVYRVRSSRTVHGVSTASDNPDSISAPGGWTTPARHLFLGAVTWLNSNATVTVPPSEIHAHITAASGTASGRPVVDVGERRHTADTLNVGAPSSTSGTLSTPASHVVMLAYDSPGEPPVVDALEWFIWDGVTLEPVDALGAWEVA